MLIRHQQLHKNEWVSGIVSIMSTQARNEPESHVNPPSSTKRRRVLALGLPYIRKHSMHCGRDNINVLQSIVPCDCADKQ